jgi:hypothetical protein
MTDIRIPSNDLPIQVTEMPLLSPKTAKNREASTFTTSSHQKVFSIFFQLNVISFFIML